MELTKGTIVECTAHDGEHRGVFHRYMGERLAVGWYGRNVDDSVSFREHVLAGDLSSVSEKDVRKA